jgi:hypothetical protein
MMRGIPTAPAAIQAVDSGIGLYLIVNGRLGILTLQVSAFRGGLKVLVPGFMFGGKKVFEAQEAFLDEEKLQDTSAWVDILTQVFFERFQGLAN